MQGLDRRRSRRTALGREDFLIRTHAGGAFGDFIERPDDSVALDFEHIQKPRYFAVEVREGEDGKLWRLDNLPGRRRFLMTVPPQVVDSTDELLLPREVVAADRED